MTNPLHSIRFPNESDEFRSARNALLEAEIELRRAVESVAEKRRALPIGGEVPEDYVFEQLSEDGDDIQEVRMSDLFSHGKNTLVIYSFMYGPKMKAACPLCTSILDGLDGQVRHIEQRVSFYVVAKSPVKRITSFARQRGWRNLHLLSSAKNTYNHDYQGEDANGDQTPGVNVFLKRDGRIYHTYGTELMLVPPDTGQDPRPVDMIWPLWNVLDYTPDGRGNWHPRLSYDE